MLADNTQFNGDLVSDELLPQGVTY